MKVGIGEQIRRNMVAIVSLTVALSGLGYNTWRNEKSERNSNIRMAGFEIMVEVGELRRVVFFSHYDQHQELGNPRTGWAHVLTIYDLSQLMPSPVPKEAGKLKAAWEAQWSNLGIADESVEIINMALDGYRNVVLSSIEELR